MKALSLKQPWAAMIAVGAKTIETRMWSTRYRGALLIVSSKKRDSSAPAIFGTGETGCTICLARLVDCRLMTHADQGAARCMWEEGRWAWILKDIKPVPHIPIKGQLGLFAVPRETMLALEAAGVTPTP